MVKMSDVIFDHMAKITTRTRITRIPRLLELNFVSLDQNLPHGHFPRICRSYESYQMRCLRCHKEIIYTVLYRVYTEVLRNQ